MGQGRASWRDCRGQLQALLAKDGDGEAKVRGAGALVPLSEVRMVLPARIGDYTDFYSSREHATNVRPRGKTERSMIS